MSKVTRHDLSKNNKTNDDKNSGVKAKSDNQNKIFNLKYTFQDNKN
jgi:hypothetical protein